MAAKNDGTDQLAASNGMPTSTGAMCLYMELRIDVDQDAESGLFAIIDYSGTPTAHLVSTDTTGTQILCYSNYLDNTPTAVVVDAVPGTAYSIFLEGSGTTLTLSIIEQGSTTILSASTTQTVFTPTKWTLLDTDVGNPSKSTGNKVGAWNTTLTSGEKLAVHASGPSAKSGYVTAREFTGATLAEALSNGSGADFAASGSGITYVPWTNTSGGAATITLGGTADVDLENPDPVAGDTAPTITTSSLSNATAGVAYSTSLAATGTEPFTWTVVGLPTGIICDEYGTISGTTTQTGTFTLDVTCSNDVDSDTASLSLTVVAAPVAVPIINTTKLTPGTQGTSYSATFDASGATPITWTFYNLPPGIVSDGATISGIPLYAAVYLVKAVATNAAGDSDPVYIQLQIDPPATPAATIPSPWASALKR